MTGCRESVTTLIVWHSRMFTAYAMPHPTADDVTLRARWLDLWMIDPLTQTVEVILH